jgi:hypothetical protein
MRSTSKWCARPDSLRGLGLDLRERIVVAAECGEADGEAGGDDDGKGREGRASGRHVRAP